MYILLISPICFGVVLYISMYLSPQSILNNPAKNIPLAILSPPAWKPATPIVAPLHQVPIARPILDNLVRKLISLEVANHGAHPLLVWGGKQVKVLRVLHEGDEGRGDSGGESKYVDQGNLDRRVIITAECQLLRATNHQGG